MLTNEVIKTIVREKDHGIPDHEIVHMVKNTFGIDPEEAMSLVADFIDTFYTLEDAKQHLLQQALVETVASTGLNKLGIIIYIWKNTRYNKREIKKWIAFYFSQLEENSSLT